MEIERSGNGAKDQKSNPASKGLEPAGIVVNGEMKHWKDLSKKELIRFIKHMYDNLLAIKTQNENLKKENELLKSKEKKSKIITLN